MSIVERASSHVFEYTKEGVNQAHENLKKEMEHRGCGCSNCQKMKVSDMNDWLDWLGSQMHYDYEDGQITGPHGEK